MQKTSELLKAIAHPIRLEIISLLGKQSSMSVTEIFNALEIEQAVASHHLAILKSKGVLKSDRAGKNCHYALTNPCYLEIMKCIETLNH
jgi:DNA-binding transcriptional ArsR family regulator